jgi:hypothetical protein
VKGCFTLLGSWGQTSLVGRIHAGRSLSRTLVPLSYPAAAHVGGIFTNRIVAHPGPVDLAQHAVSSTCINGSNWLTIRELAVYVPKKIVETQRNSLRVLGRVPAVKCPNVMVQASACVL